MEEDRHAQPEELAGEKRDPTINPSRLVGMARGFALVFWGIPLGLLLFAGAIRIESLYSTPIPTYLLGVVLVFAGMLWLYAAGPPTRRWSRSVRRALVVLFLQVYFSPFVFWWRSAPEVSYYQVNVLGLLLCTMWMLFLVNQLVAELASLMGDASFRMEARISGASVILLLVLPLSASFFHSLRASLVYEPSVYLEMIQLRRVPPRWALLLSVLPFMLTMVCCWMAKERCLAVLRLGNAESVSRPSEKM